MQVQHRLGFWPGFISVTIALLIDLGMSLRTLPSLRDGGLSNPDSYMRMVRLRDMLDQGRILHDVARDGSGHGTLLHWSHLLDAAIGLTAAPFRLFLDPHDALYAAAVIFGPLNIAVLALLIAWAAAPFAERKFLWLGAALVPLSPAIASYGLAGVVHHHVAIVIAAAAAWGLAARIVLNIARPGAGIALGVCAAAGLWLTPESLPLTMMGFGALFLAWIVLPDRDDIPRAIRATGLAFASVTAMALILDPPAAGLGSAEIDRISLLSGALSIAIAATGLGLWAAHPLARGPGRRAAMACAIGGGCCGVWVALFQAALFRSNMALHPGEWDAFFGHINEMKPVAGVLEALHYLLTGTLAAAAMAFLAYRRRSLFLGYAALCAAGTLAAGFLHVRFAAYPEAAGAIALPAILTLISAAAEKWPPVLGSLGRLTATVLFVQVPYLGQLPMFAPPARAATEAGGPGCRFAEAAGLLRDRPGEVVLSDANDSPEILYRTRALTVGSLYHRNVPAFLRLRAAWRLAPSETVPRDIAAADISLVIGCESPFRSPLVADIEGASLSDLVRTGQPPVWLRRVAEHPASGHVLYRVVYPD